MVKLWGEEVGGEVWGGGCLRQEDQMGQGRVEGGEGRGGLGWEAPWVGA